MSFPSQKEVELPLLQVLDESGGEALPRDVYFLVAKHFPYLTEEEQNQKMESAPSHRKWWNLVQWVRQNLVERGEIDGSVRGLWKITPAGLNRLKALNSSKNREPKQVLQTELTLRDLVNQNVDKIRNRLITELKALTPTGFEKFCRALLEQLGYEDVQVTGRAADGGIDGFGDFRQGVVRIKSAFQAKRWKDNPIGRPEIDKFRGSIQGEYDHGVFLTTSKFTKDAKLASIKRGAITILMLDGNAIAELMIEKGLGVIKQQVYLSDLDEDFFDFE